MHTRTFTIAVLTITLLLGCRDATTPKGSTTPDFKFIDSHLAKMPQGGGAISIQDDETRRFRAQLGLALSQKDRRAPSRMVFHTVHGGVGGRGFIPYESEIGRACYALFADEVPLIHIQPGMAVYAEADIYFWWERHKGEYEAFPLYDSWQQSDHAKKTVIPKYESLKKK